MLVLSCSPLSCTMLPISSPALEGAQEAESAADLCKIRGIARPSRAARIVALACISWPAGGLQQGGVKVEVGGLRQAALIHRASWRQPDHHLQQVCATREPQLIMCPQQASLAGDIDRQARLAHHAALAVSAALACNMTCLPCRNFTLDMSDRACLMATHACKKQMHKSAPEHWACASQTGICYTSTHSSNTHSCAGLLKFAFTI